jgi:hypothetical protein
MPAVLDPFLASERLLSSKAGVHPQPRRHERPGSPVTKGR